MTRTSADTRCRALNQRSAVARLLHYSITQLTDLSQQLQRLHEAGFGFETFERYPRAVGAVRDSCIALLEPAADGLHIIGTPGWRMGEVMGVLVEKDGRQVFQAKSEIVEATPERLQTLWRFREDLENLLAAAA
jgi:hypothetical protein